MYIPKTVHSLMEKLVVRGSGFLQLLLAMRLLESAELGSYFLAVSIFFYFSTVREGVLKSAYISLSAGSEKERGYFSAAVGMGTLFSVVGAVVVLLTSPLFGMAFHSSSIPSLLNWLALLLVVEFPAHAAVWRLYRHENFQKPLVIRTIEQIVLFAAIGVLWYQGIRDARILVIARIAGSLAASLVSLNTVIRSLELSRHSWAATVSHAKELVLFGRFSVATLISSRLYRSADLYLIALFLGEESVALYGIAARLSDYVEVPLQAVGERIFPRIAKLLHSNEHDSAVTVIKTAVIQMAVVTLPVTLVFLVAPQQILTLFAGEGYRHGATLVRIWGIFTLFRPLDRLTGICLDALKLPAMNMKKTAFATIANVICNSAILLLFSSMEGVALVSVVTQIGGILFGISVIHHEIAHTTVLSRKGATV